MLPSKDIRELACERAGYKWLYKYRKKNRNSDNPLQKRQVSYFVRAQQLTNLKLRFS